MNPSSYAFASMNIQENISLKPYNTFQIDKSAKLFVEARTPEEVIKALQIAKNNESPVFILGGGSNILLTKDVQAMVIKVTIKGIEVTDETDDHIWVKVGAGEVWHEFVLHAIANNWAGIENLSLIPGTVGASPLQNIGAYGVEIKDVFEQLSAINRHTLEEEVFTGEQCHFGYRESIFKNDLKDQYVITSVSYKLTKKPQFKVSYGAIQQTLESRGIQSGDFTIKAISDAVIAIRQSKLPDPKVIGNAGSFFKNPVLSAKQFKQLQDAYPDVPGYPQPDGVKIPAAWLIEQAGWKGRTFGEIGVHKNQPLVLVNYGDGDGLAIKTLAENIQSDISSKFGINLFPEVNFI